MLLAVLCVNKNSEDGGDWMEDGAWVGRCQRVCCWLCTSGAEGKESIWDGLLEELLMHSVCIAGNLSPTVLNRPLTILCALSRDSAPQKRFQVVLPP